MKGGKSRPIAGFFPNFWCLGETIPLIKIANEYLNLGGEAIFFSHGGKYERLAKDIGCKVIRLSDIMKEFTKTVKKMVAKGAPGEKIIVKLYKEEFIRRAVEEEIEAFSKSKIKLVISTNNLTNSISARALKIPLVVVISGTSIPPYYDSDFCRFPENYENAFTKIVPQSVKNQICKWYILHCKYLVKEFNRVAKEYHVQPFRYFNDILLGDYTFVCDDINFLGLTPSEEFPKENYIGPIYHWDFFEDQQEEINARIKNHLDRPGKSILLSMGSTGDKKLFLRYCL